MPAQGYFPISPLLLHPGAATDFRVYLRRGDDSHLLYCSQDDAFTEAKQQRLFDMGVEEVFIPLEDHRAYRVYAEEHLGDILNDAAIPASTRGKVFYDTSLDLAKEALRGRLPDGLAPAHLERVAKLVEDCLGFLSGEANLAEVAKLMRHDYETYSHSVNVFVLSASLLRARGMDEKVLKPIGVGAVLHDIGKSRIPREILRKPGRLNPDEFAEVMRHPVLGQALCMNLELEAVTTNVVLYHHEKLDGSGYPAGLDGNQLPEYVRAVTIADIYDALTSKRAYADAMSPFAALKLMSDEFNGKIDSGLMEAFVKMLSGTLS